MSFSRVVGILSAAAAALTAGATAIGAINAKWAIYAVVAAAMINAFTERVQGGKSVAVLLLCVGLLSMQIGCSPKLEKALDAVFIAAPIAVDEAERQGVITADLAGQLRVDIPDGKRVTDNLIAKLKAIPKDASDRRAQQLAAWQAAELDWLAIVNRGHFALNAKMNGFADRANELFSTAIQIYGGVSAQKEVAPAHVSPNMSDVQIEEMLLSRLEGLAGSLK